MINDVFRESLEWAFSLFSDYIFVPAVMIARCFVSVISAVCPERLFALMANG